MAGARARGDAQANPPSCCRSEGKKQLGPLGAEGVMAHERAGTRKPGNQLRSFEESTDSPG